MRTVTIRTSQLVAIGVSVAALVAVSCGGSGLPNHAPPPDLATSPAVPTVSPPTAHRPSSPPACTPQSAGYCPSGMGGPCAKDADCTGGLDGRCVVDSPTTCGCRYDACLTDADCAAGTDCACDALRGGAGSSGNPTECLPSNCRTDADCGSRYCSPSITGYCGGNSGWFCHTAADECGIDADCPAATAGMRAVCNYSHELAHWACSTVPFCAG